MAVSWIQPGDDWLCGSPDRYQVIVSANPIDDPGDGEVIVDAAASGGAGRAVSRTLTGPRATAARYVAVLYRDETRTSRQLGPAAKRANHRTGRITGLRRRRMLAQPASQRFGFSTIIVSSCSSVIPASRSAGITSSKTRVMLQPLAAPAASSCSSTSTGYQSSVAQ